MIIPEQILEKWNKLNSHGDFKRISEKSGISYQTIWAAHHKGMCSKQTFEAIAEFYAEREEMLREYMD